MDERIAPEIAFQQAVAFQNQGNLTAAEQLYRAILKQHRTHYGTLLNLAGVLLRERRFEEAIQVARKALNQNRNSADALTVLATALQQLERHDEALERARRAVVLDPSSARAHSILGEVLSELGRYDEARAAYGRAIDLAPDQPFLYFMLGYIARWTPGDPRLAALEALAEKSESLAPDDLVRANFALGKAYADCGDTERAYRRQIMGGALRRRTLHYDEASTLRWFDEVCGAFDADWISGHKAVGDPSPMPIFIVGMPRSGTTLVEQILASHPKVHAHGERPDFDAALTRLRGKPGAPLTLAQVAAPWSDADLHQLGALYLQAARRGTPPSATRVTDKMPENFRFAGLIHAALPKARIIHTIRDPIDTCLSIFSILFAGELQPYSYDPGELGRYYRAYEKVMAHWREVLPADVMIDVRYEDVVDDVERQARRIVAHCGLEWDDACLAFHKTDRAVRTASHAQVRQPIYRSSIGRPRPSRALLLPLLAALGVD